MGAGGDAVRAQAKVGRNQYEEINQAGMQQVTIHLGIAAGCEETAQERFAMVGEELWAVRQCEAWASHLADEAWGCAEDAEAGAHEESGEEEEACAAQGLGEVGL